MEELRRAAEAHDSVAVIALFSPDIIVRSPITQLIRFEGYDQVSDLFERIFKVISDIQFYETIGEGTNNQVIFWKGRVGSEYLEEANLIRLDDQGRIREMTVFMRPIPGLLALASVLAPSLATRRGPIRAFMVRSVLWLFYVIYRTAEPLVIGLNGAGVPVRSGAISEGRLR